MWPKALVESWKPWTYKVIALGGYCLVKALLYQLIEFDTN